MKDKLKANIIYIFLFLQPFLDLFTSFMVRYTNITITIGMIARGIFLLLLLLYVVIFNKSVHKKKSLIYLSILFVFCILYFVTKIDIFKIEYLKTEIIYMFKYLYFPIVAICLINVYDELNLEKEKIFKICFINAIIYSSLILLPEFTGTAFSSYDNSNQGTVGWFYAANEIGAIIVSLFPYMYYIIFERNNIIKTIILFMIVILAMTLLGTKTSFIGMLITEIVYFIYYLINYKKNRGLGVKICLIIIVLSFGLIPNIPAVKNLQSNIEEANKVVEEISPSNSENFEAKVNNKNVRKLTKVILSSRDIYFFNTLDIYGNSRFDDKLFGIGFVNRNEINNKSIEKLVEIDPLDIFLHYGIIGFVFYFGPLVYILFKAIKAKIKEKLNVSFFKLTNIYIICIVTAISMIAGHIYGAPGVSIYVAISIAMLDSAITKNCLSEAKKNNRKKITIFALHLGFGGVEQYLSSLCKMLENKYEIEIICTYKVLDKPAFPFSDKIKITYLINEKPNREEFKTAIKEKNIIKIIKEGFKSIKILYLKRIKNISAIRNNYSDYVITTRSFHNTLVGYYSYDKIIKIATEHNYHNDNKKYINKVIKSIKGFDYFVVVSKSLKQFYSDKIGETKCIYIPNVIDDLPTKESNLKENILINIGRLEQEKGQEDLIEIIKTVKKEIKDVKLYLIGDGSLKKELEAKVKKEELEDNIIFTGFITKKEIEKYITKSKLFVLTSYTESFGLVLIEAMSYKVPCIAFDCANGAKELLSNDVGLLIKDRNINEMSHEIITLLKDKKLLNKYSNNGYKKCQEYIGENVKKDWYGVLE